MGAVAGLLPPWDRGRWIAATAPPGLRSPVMRRRGNKRGAGGSAAVQAPGRDRPGDRLAAFGAGAGGGRAAGLPVRVRADGGIADVNRAGRAGRRAGGYAAGGGVRADRAGVAANRGVL